MVVSEFCNFSYWWIFPIVMMILCFFIMKGRRWTMMCGFGRRDADNHQSRGSGSAMEILDERYASGEINKEEYKEKRRNLSESNDIITD